MDNLKCTMTLIVNEQDIRKLIKKDKLFEYIYKRYKLPPAWARPQGFVSLCRIILEQQVSLASANAHFIKLDTYLKGIDPHGILKLTDEEMRFCQISRQKSMYLRELSNAILNKNINLEGLSNSAEPEIRRQLVSIKGIGNWTADIYLMFCLQAKDVFPFGDVAIINTMKELTAATTKEEIISLAEKWMPFRSLATYFLWHYYLEKRAAEKSAIITAAG